MLRTEAGERLAYEVCTGSSKHEWLWAALGTYDGSVEPEIGALVFALRWLDSKPSCHGRLAGLPFA